MPANTPVPSEWRLAAPAPRRDHQRRHAEDERERGHENRPEALAGRLHRRFAYAASSGPQLRGELHDQDRVLRRQTDHGDETDLEVDVARDPPEPDAEERPHHAERNAKKDGEGDGPALVLCRQHQEHQHQAEREHHARLAGRCPLLIGLAAVGEAEALVGVLAGEQPFDRVELLARADARRRGGRHHRRREAVEAAQHARRAPELGPRQRRERDHLAAVGPHVEPPDVLGRLPEARLRLGLHPVGPAVDVEVVDVE